MFSRPCGKMATLYYSSKENPAWSGLDIFRATPLKREAGKLKHLGRSRQFYRPMISGMAFAGKTESGYLTSSRNGQAGLRCALEFWITGIGKICAAGKITDRVGRKRYPRCQRLGISRRITVKMPAVRRGGGTYSFQDDVKRGWTMWRLASARGFLDQKNEISTQKRQRPPELERFKVDFQPSYRSSNRFQMDNHSLKFAKWRSDPTIPETGLQQLGETAQRQSRSSAIEMSAHTHTDYVSATDPTGYCPERQGCNRWLTIW